MMALGFASTLSFFLPLQQSSAAPGGAASGGEWSTALGTVQGTRYSSLDQINNSNAGNLIEERVIKTSTKAGHEGQPLVVNISGKKRMFVVTPWPNKLIALDTTGKILWTYSPDTKEYAQGQACCDVVNRGAAYADGKVVYSRLDGTVVAVNASTGSLVWQTKIADMKVGETLTGAPIIAGKVSKKVIVGNAGGEMGVRGWVQGLDLTTGKVVWKAFSTGPDADVKLTTATKNYYVKDQGTNLGSTTWGTDIWKHGGATTWAWFTYDPDLNLVYYGTANPGVWNPDMRPGDNKWSASIFARNPDTGVAKWINQLTPHDGWDYDAMNESIVISTTDSPSGKALMHFNKNGFAYMLDAATGQVIKADPFVSITWAKGFDMAKGAPIVADGMAAQEGKVTSNICPSPLGGKEFSPASYSPKTGLFYVPGINFCSSLHPLKTNYISGTPFLGADVGFSPDWIDLTTYTYKPFGELIAWNPNGTRAWTGPAEAAPLFSGVLATAGNVVFYGTLDRKFKALDATNGNLLYSKDLECGVMSNPITYTGDDGKQRVAVYSGIGWLPGGFVGGPCPGESDANKGYESGAVHIFRLP
jgi:alcohol dehydrogenase (cytochrome c)